MNEPDGSNEMEQMTTRDLLLALFKAEVAECHDELQLVEVLRLLILKRRAVEPPAG
jgi:hypothetical protein